MKLKTNRRQFIGTLGLTTVASTVNIPSIFAKESLKQEKHQFLTSPYLQALTPNNVSIVCLTSNQSFTWIEYGDTDLSQKAYVEKDGFIDAYQTLFNIRLFNLKPGTTYRYQVVSKEIKTFEPYKLVYGDEIRSEAHTFTTPLEQSQEVSCLIFNDIHDRPDSFKELMRFNGDSSFDFVILNGDMFNYQADEKQIIDHLIEPTTQLFASETPFIMSRGNHETRGKFARDFKNYFAYTDDRYYQAYRQGPIFWIFLDTGEDKPDDAPVYAGIVDFDSYREEQAQWLEEVMQSSAYRKAPFKVVCMHIPPFHSGDWHGTMHCRELFNPLFEKNKIDLVISGHTHKYGIHEKQNDHSYPIVIGGGPKDGTRTIIRLQADQKAIQINMKGDNGDVVGELTIKK